jgi:hypothetical protein
MQISMGVDNLWSQTLFYIKSYLMNFRRWNYNCAFYYYYYMLMEQIIAKRDATDRFFAVMSKKRQ